MSGLANELVAQLSLEEKVALVSGADVWQTAAIERLGIGAVKVTDGPNGARGDSTTGARAVCLPASIALGASFDVELVTEVGRLLGRETVRKGAHVLLAPTINIARHPLGGRNFECMGEDPMLTSVLSSAYIAGVQDEGVGACAKHLVANDVEWHRLTVSSEVAEPILREVYLAPFEAATESGVWTMMAAYPQLNGTHCTEHEWLLTDLLRDEWGFDGLVMSDWGATLHHARPIIAGLDLEMPGPSTALGGRLQAAVESGEVALADLDQRVLRVVQLAERAGKIGNLEAALEQSVDLPEERALARRAAAAGTVLLRNTPGSSGTPVLPFDKDSITSVAILGPNAAPGVIQGGGSAQLPAHHIMSPVDGLREAIPAATITHYVGVLAHRYLPLIARDQWVPHDDRKPVLVEMFDNQLASGDVFQTKSARNIHTLAQGPTDGLTHPMRWSQRLTGSLRIDQTGEHAFGIMQTGQARVFVDGDLVVDNWTSTEQGQGFFEKAAAERIGSVHLEADSVVEVVVEWNRGDDSQLGGVRLGWLPPVDEDALLDEAVAAAASADAAVVVVGLDADWETESHDRPMFGLPGRQDELIRRVSAANSKTVVVVNAGSAIDMPWLDDVPAALMVWYPGQEFGGALADVLLGVEDPGGRMPVTFPRRVEDGPTASSVPGTDEKLHYSEGLLVGHRWYDKHNIDPLVEFGFGLSYASFEFGEPEVVGSTVAVRVTNTANRSGTCVVQGYLAPPDALDGRPDRILAGFATVTLDAGAQSTVQLNISDRSFARWSDDGWTTTPGDYVLSLGTSSRNFFSQVTFSR